jgi:hypothetical protein
MLTPPCVCLQRRSISAQNGLPDLLPFSLNMTSVPGLAQDPAQTADWCLELVISLEGLMTTIVKSVNVHVVVTQPCPAGTYSASGLNVQGARRWQ